MRCQQPPLWCEQRPNDIASLVGGSVRGLDDGRYNSLDNASLGVPHEDSKEDPFQRPLGGCGGCVSLCVIVQRIVQDSLSDGLFAALP